ncbi:hypothetical protein ACSTJT_20800 [Vibrio parahaemolyticus]
MKTKLHCYRIYAARKSYSGTPFERPVGSPLLLHDFIDDKTTVRLHIGDITQELKESIIVRQALASNNPLLPSDRPRLKGDELIAIALQQYRGESLFTNKEWLVCIEAIVEVDIPEDKLSNQAKHFWLDVNYARHTWHETKDSLKSKFDDIMGFIIPYIGEDFIGDVVIEHYYYEPADSKQGIYTYPEMTASAQMWMQSSINTIDMEQISNKLKHLKSQPKQLKFISTVRHWYLNTINETDAWKLFLWSFWGLEVLAKKYLDRYYDQIKTTNAKDQKIETDEFLFQEHVVQSLLPEKNRAPLAASFAIMSTVLSPKDSENDTKSFRKLAKLRNSLSHGEAINTDQIPAHEAQQLFHKYYKLAIDDITKNA